MVDLRSGCARVLVTARCNRACPYCVNGNSEVMAKAQAVNYPDLMERLTLFRELAVTGGEPMLDVLSTMALIDTPGRRTRASRCGCTRQSSRRRTCSTCCRR